MSIQRWVLSGEQLTCAEDQVGALYIIQVRVQTVHSYDTALYPFTEFVCEALGVEPSALASLHQTPEGSHAQQKPPRSGHDPFRRRWLTFISTHPEARRRLDAIVKSFVATRVRVALGDRWDHFVYQASQE